MCYEWDGIKPDIVSVGKALSGGMMPVSGAFANNEIMDLIKPGEHGSTYGGNPLAMAVAKTSIEVLLEEKMVENSLKMGEILLNSIKDLKHRYVKEVRGRGLFVGIELKEGIHIDGNDLAYAMMKRGILTKATHDSTVRLAPCLTINEK